jgi:hypothetical protein
MPTTRIPVTVCSVSLELAEALNPRLVQAWLSVLLLEQGNDIFRVKSVLHLAGWSVAGVCPASLHPGSDIEHRPQ